MSHEVGLEEEVRVEPFSAGEARHSMDRQTFYEKFGWWGPHKRGAWARMIALCLALGALGWGVWHEVRQHVVLPWLAAQITAQVEQRFGWRVRYEAFSSNLWDEVHFYGVHSEPTEGGLAVGGRLVPVAVVAERVWVQASPLDLLRGRIRDLQVDRCRLLAGALDLGVHVTHANRTILVRWPLQRIALPAVGKLLFVPKELSLEGEVLAGGEWLFERYRSRQLRIRVRGEDVGVRWAPKLDTHINLALELHGAPQAPSLEGSLELVGATWTSVGTAPIGTALGAERPFVVQWADHFPGSIELRAKSADFKVHTDRLKAKLAAEITLQKRANEAARLVGKAEAIDGYYAARSHRFTIVSGMVEFPDREGVAPALDVLLETRVKRYRIQASVFGTLGNSQLRLKSHPELAREDILALLVFGKKRSNLSDEQRRQLAEEGEMTQVLDMLFLGRAELLAERLLGVDEINVQVATPQTDQATGPALESVEVGKYLIPDRLFGSYKVEPPRTAGSATKHTVGAAYQWSERFSVEGTVKASVDNAPRAVVETEAATKRRVETEEAFIRFRWKF